MNLPMPVMPVYTLSIPSSKKNVRYRPFTVKEEKSLLIAQQSDDPLVMLDTLKEIITTCVKDPLETSELAVFDIEYIFSQLRAHSVGEVIDLRFQCDICKTDPKAVSLVQIDLTKLQVKFKPGHEKKIPLFDNVGIVMKYPGLEAMKLIENITDFDDMNQVFDLITNYSIDYIYDDEQVYHAKDFTSEKLAEFINSLTSKQFENIAKFFRTLPTLRQDIEYKCPVCGHIHNKYIEGLSSFFM